MDIVDNFVKPTNVLVVFMSLLENIWQTTIARFLSTVARNCRVEIDEL